MAKRRAICALEVIDSSKTAGRIRELPKIWQAKIDRCIVAAENATGLFAVRPKDPEKLRRALTQTMRHMQNAAPMSTLDTEDSNWKHWSAVCEEWGISTIRNSVHQIRAHGGDDLVDLEVAIWADAFPIIKNRMYEAWCINGRGRELPPKPSSVLQVLRGIRRAHRRMQIDTVSLTACVQVCDGMLREYAEVHGPEALIPHRKEPYTNQMIVDLLSLPNGTRIGRDTIQYDLLKWAEIRALIAFMAQTGFRKAEVSLPSKADYVWGKMHLALTNIVWFISDADPSHTGIPSPTPAQFALLKIGDYCTVRPPPSKADQLSLHWGASTMYLHWHPTDTICAARYLAECEVMRGIKPQDRRASPLFVDGKGDCLRHGNLDKLLPMLLQAINIPEPRLKCYSWHSFRVYLACALLACKACPATIQALLRWRSAEAVNIYARIHAEDYRTWLANAATADILTVRTTNLPVVDSDVEAAELQGSMTQMHISATEEME